MAGLRRTPRETGRVVEEAAHQVSVASEGVHLKTGGGQPCWEQWRPVACGGAQVQLPGSQATAFSPHRPPEPQGGATGQGDRWDRETDRRLEQWGRLVLPTFRDGFEQTQRHGCSPLSSSDPLVNVCFFSSRDYVSDLMFLS